MSGSSNASNKDEELEKVLKDLSAVAFKTRTPVVVYLSLIIIFGFVGNSLVLLVYRSRFKPSATRIFILFMATLDFTANVLAMPVQLYTIHHAYNADIISCRLLLGSSTISTQASGIVLVLVAVDRFRRLCLPWKKQLDHRRALYFTATAVGLCFLVFSSFIPYYGMHRLNITESAVEVRMCWYDDRYKNTVYPLAYKVVVGIFFSAGLTVTVSCYIMIGIRLWKKKWDKKNKVGHESIDFTDRPTSQSLGGMYYGKYRGFFSSFRASSVAPSSVPRTSDYSRRKSITSSGKWNEMMEASVKLGDTDHMHDHTRSTAEASQKFSYRRCLEEAKSSLVWNSRVCQYVERIRSQTTLVMCVLTVMYIVNWLPHFIARAMYDKPVNLCKNYTDCGFNIYAIALRSNYLNCAINAVVYSFCNAKFRTQCRLFFKGMFKEDRNER